MTRAALAALGLALAAAACDPRDVLPPDPATATRRADDAAALRVRAHLRALPVIHGAAVAVARPAVDPLARTVRTAPPQVAVTLVADADADADVVTGWSRRAVALELGADAHAAVTVLPVTTHPRLARLGPFTVAAEARGPLLALVVGGLVVIAGLAGVLTWLVARRPARP